MPITIQEGFDVNSPFPIDKRLIVDRVSGTTASLVSLTTGYNYKNMYVWVRSEKAFYYLIDIPTQAGATSSDWTKLISGSGSVSGSASAIDITEVAFGTGTGITSSNNFTWNNACNNLIASKSSNITNGSCESAIIGGASNDIINSDSSLISGNSNNIYSSPRSSIIGGGGNSIGTQSQTVKQPSDNSRNVIIGGSSNEISGSSSYNSSIIGGYTSYIKQSKQSVILGGIGLTLSNEDSVVYVPELKIATASNSSTTDKVLVWDTTDNYVKWRSDSSLGLAKNAKKVAWQEDPSNPTMPGQTHSWGLTAGQDPNTVWFYNGLNSFDSPQGDIVVSLNPATANPGLNRDFKLILGNGGRVETGNTWSVAYNGTRLVEYTEGRIEPHVLDFSWATSSEAPNGEYLLTKYMLESPTNDSVTTGAAYGGDFTSVKRMMGYFGSLYTTYGTPGSPNGRGGSTVFPKGSILFVNESFVTCEGITGSVTGITISFGLTQPTPLGSYGALINQWEPSLASFGVPHSGKIIFPDKALGDFATGSVYYSNSPVGIIRLTEPAMIVITVEGGAIATYSYLKCQVPYIVDEASINTISSGTNYIASPNSGSGSQTGSASSFLPLPVPKINLMQGTQSVQVYNSATNGIFATHAMIHNYPVLINMDFTSDHFSNPDNRIFIEMVYYRRKSRKTFVDPLDLITPIKKKKGKSYVVPAKNIEDVGQDESLPWIAAGIENGYGGFWSRGGNSYWSDGSPGSSVLLGIDRPNHVEVTSYTMSSYPIWEYLNGRFEFYDVAYRFPTSTTQSTTSYLNTLIPNSTKGRVGPNSPTKRFPYSPYYTPYYCAFRYIQWIPSANGGRGQIVSGPLSKVIKVTGLRFPFQTNYQKSATQLPNSIPVCEINPLWFNSGNYRRLKCDWESNLP